MVISKKWSVLGIALLATLLFALPAFAQWNQTQVRNVTFQDSAAIPQNAMVVTYADIDQDGVNETCAFVAAYDAHRLIVYGWNFEANATNPRIWLVDGDLVSPTTAGAYPSMAVVEDNNRVGKFLIVSYISGNALKAAVFDIASNYWAVTTVRSNLSNPAYTSVGVGYLDYDHDGIFETVAAIAVGGDELKLAVIDLDRFIPGVPSQLDSYVSNSDNWFIDDVDKGAGKRVIGVDVFLTNNMNTLYANTRNIFYGKILISYFLEGTGLKLAISDDGDNWSGAHGKIVVVDSENDINGDTSLWAMYETDAVTATAAIAIAYIDWTDNQVKLTAFATSMVSKWDITKLEGTMFYERVVDQSGVAQNNVDLAISGFATSATVAIAYLDYDSTSKYNRTVVLSTSPLDFRAWADPAPVGWTRACADEDHRSAGFASLYYTSNPYVVLSNRAWAISLVCTEDGQDTLVFDVDSHPSSLTKCLEFADASEFGYGYSVVYDSKVTNRWYHESFFDAPLRTLGYLRYTLSVAQDGTVTVAFDPTLANPVMNPSCLAQAGDGWEVKTLRAGWNTVIDVDSRSEPHIVFTYENLAGVYYVYDLASGAGWSNHITVGAPKDYRNVRDIAFKLDASDKAHVAWVDADIYDDNRLSHRGGIFYRYGSYPQDVLANWASTETLQVSATDDSNIDMAVEGNNIYIAAGYYEEDTERAFLRFFWRVAGETQLHNASIREDLLGKTPQVALAVSGGQATIVFTSMDGNDNLLYIRGSANNWPSADSVVDNNRFCAEPYVVVGSGGNVYVLYKAGAGAPDYYRFGVVGGNTDWVYVGGSRVSTAGAWGDGTKLESLLRVGTRVFAFYKAGLAVGRTNVMTEEEPTPPAQPSISVSASGANVGSCEVGQSISGTVTITLTGANLTSNATVNWSIASLPTGWTVTEGTSGSVTVNAPNGTATITLHVTFAPTSAGSSSFTVNLTGPAGVTISPSSVTVSATATEAPAGGGGGCSASDVGSLGLALLLVGPAILALRKK